MILLKKFDFKIYIALLAISLLLSSQFSYAQTSPIGKSFKVQYEISLRDKDSLSAKTILKIPAKGYVKLIYDDGFFCKVHYKDTTGFIFRSAIDKDLNEIKAINAVFEHYRIDSINQAERLKVLIKKYGKKKTNRIISHEIWIGMSEELAEESLGKPNRINRTVMKRYTHEQWVYDNMNLYFENGILTGWQD